MVRVKVTPDNMDVDPIEYDGKTIISFIIDPVIPGQRDKIATIMAGEGNPFDLVTHLAAALTSLVRHLSVDPVKQDVMLNIAMKVIQKNITGGEVDEGVETLLKQVIPISEEEKTWS